MAVQKYGSMRRDGCTEIWKHEGGMIAQKYGSMRGGCTKILKHEEGWLYRNMEA
jgi:hypothetical protein